MSGPVRSSEGGLEYPEREYGTDDLEIDVEATPATVGSYTGFRASTNSLVAPAVLLDQIVPFPHPYKVNLPQALGAGFCATLVFTLFWYPLFLGFKNNSMDIFGLLGSFFVPGEPGGLTHLVGFLIHLGIGMALAVSYAYGMMFLRTQSHGGKGAIFGAGLFMFMSIWVLPWVAPLAVYGASHAHFDMPSPFLEWLGAGDNGWDGFAIGLLANVMFGLIIGAVYRHKLVDPALGV